MDWYGVDFPWKGTGIGAWISHVMLAYHYAEINHHELCLTSTGWPELNGSIDESNLSNEPNSNKTWNSYFKFPSEIKSKKECIAVWQDCPNGFTNRQPQGYTRIEWYSKLLKQIFTLQDSVAQEVESQIRATGFNPDTDVTLHIRRTDKIFQKGGTGPESTEVSLSRYVHETLKVLESNNRVFVCTDDKKIIDEVKVMFSQYGINVIWDKTETELEIHLIRNTKGIPKSVALAENITSIKNIVLLSRGLKLVGARMSYTYRIAELLHYPKLGYNIRDNDKYSTPYAEDDAPILTGKYRCYPNFVSNIDCTNSPQKLNRKSLVVIKNFINTSAMKQIKDDIYQFSNQPKKSGGHYLTCKCFTCRISDTFDSPEMLEILSRITGKHVIKLGDSSVSFCEKGNAYVPETRGVDYGFILFLTTNSNIRNGGLLFFHHDRTIYKTIVPEFGMLCIFEIESNSYFISAVTGVEKCCFYSGYFSTQFR